MKKVTKALFVLGACLNILLVSCNDYALNTETTFSPDTSSDEISLVSSETEAVVLGKKMGSPFSATALRAANPDIEANYYYFRLRTCDASKIEWLEEKYSSLTSIPLDYEIEDGGFYLPENVSDGNTSPWFYFIDSVENYELLTDNFETEILDEMYVTPSEQEYSEDADGYADRAATKASPSGCIKVYDEILGKAVPLKNARIEINHFLATYTAYTDENGYYKINKTLSSFWGKARVSVIFDNSACDVRSADNYLFLTKGTYLAGTFSVESLANMTITFNSNLENLNSQLKYLYHTGYYDLIDSGNEEGDMCSGVTVAQIFACYKSYDVVSFSTWLDRFAQLYPRFNKDAVKQTMLNNGAKL